MPTFATTLQGVEGMNATGIVIPPEVIEALGGGKRPKIVVTVNGFTYRSTAGVMGGRTMVGVTAEQRAKSGLKAGDPIDVTLELDTAPREVEAPPDLLAAIDAAGARAAWDKLAYSHRKEHVRSVEEAKSPETRQRRIDKAVAAVAAKA